MNNFFEKYIFDIGISDFRSDPDLFSHETDPDPHQNQKDPKHSIFSSFNFINSLFSGGVLKKHLTEYNNELVSHQRSESNQIKLLTVTRVNSDIVKSFQ